MFDSEDGREQLRAFKQVAVLVAIAGLGMWLFINWLSSKPSEQNQSASQIKGTASTQSQAPPAPAPKIDPHQQRVADLRDKLRSIDFSMAVEIEMAKKLRDEAMDMSTQRFPDPGERQWLMEKMDAQHNLLTELAEKKKAIEADLAQEEQPNIAPDPTTSSGSNTPTVQSDDVTENQNAKCVENLEQHYTAQLAVATCRCVMDIYKKTGSAERAQNAAGQCSATALQALTNPGRTATLPWDAIQ